MKIPTLVPLAVLLLASPAVLADSSYEQTSRMNGGQLLDALKSMPMLSKQMQALTDPVSEITMVHGNQKAIVRKDSTEITDLDKEVIIHIDNVNKTYSVMTFDQMRKIMQQMPQKMEQMQPQAPAGAQHPQTNLQTSYSVTVSDTGLTKAIAGQTAKQQILTLKMTVTDPDHPGTNVAYTMTTEIWTVPDVPEEMREIQDFDKRYGQQLMKGVDADAMLARMNAMRQNRGANMAMLFGNQPGAADAFAQSEKELAKITGTKVVEITRMGGTGTGIQPAPAQASGQPQNGQPQNQNGSAVAGQVAKDTAAQTAAGESSSHLGIPGAALGGALMNAWGRHKNKPAAQPAPASAPAQTTPAQTAPGTTTTDVTLLEMTTETNNFSRETIPSSVFQIPDGYKQVPSPLERMMAK